jgi:sulfatase modifying factor 1
MKYPSKINVAGILALGAAVVLMPACKKEVSRTTGWTYNDPRNGGFEKIPYIEQETGPGLVLIEGGTFAMGRVEQEVNYNWDNAPRRVTVSSFYMDETEVTNLDYREYLYWLTRVYGEDYPEVVKKAKPDTLVWRSKLAFNEPYVEYYFRHPAYQDYPVVGVDWVQATNYCSWRTDRVNETILIREGILQVNPNQIAEDNFNTEAYLEGQYEGLITKRQLKNLGPQGGDRRVRMEDGILLPKYRLPTEAEWEYAALSLVGNTDPSTDREIVKERRLYPWNGHIARNPNDAFKGDFLANFRRGRGDMMGSAGRLNDNADITAPVFSYWPNDFGLYNMAGNVAEWTMDLYRPLNSMDLDEFRPHRGNVFKKKLLDDEGNIAEKDSLGRIQYVNVTEDDALNRRNYKKADYRDYKDGDYKSSIYYEDESYTDEAKQNELMYEFSVVSLINNKARVVKGGSWKDAAYWLVPGTRRFMDENTAADWIGFRCAMDRLGSPVGLGNRPRKGPGGGQYGGKK